MKAQIGERLLFHGKKVGSTDHTAEVLRQERRRRPSVPRSVRRRPRAAHVPRDGLPGPARRPPGDPRRRDLQQSRDPWLAAVDTRNPLPPASLSLDTPIGGEGGRVGT